MAKIEYSSNNSGGSWWLSDEDWKALEAAGWDVEWVADEEEDRLISVKNDRWLGALATRASKETSDPQEAVREFERITGQNAGDIGCTCCGPPHDFTFEDDEGNRSYPEREVSSSLSF
jgi:hypothetical protein